MPPPALALIRRELGRHNGDRKHTAKALGISYSSVRRFLDSGGQED